MKNCADCNQYKYSYAKQPEDYILISENKGSTLGIKYAKCESGNNDENESLVE